MIDSLLEKLAPHPCYGCAKIGSILCDNCKYDIIQEATFGCIVCGRNEAHHGTCSGCRLPYQRAWWVGERSGILQQIIGGYKFLSVRAAHQTLADLLIERLDELPPETVLVPIPTVSAHVRERGFDHMQLIAERIAKKRGLKVKHLLSRATNTKQRDASKHQRIEQAKRAFTVRQIVDGGVPYLIIDDVVTTGATLYYAAHTLQDAGARDIWVAAIARQPLD